MKELIFKKRGKPNYKESRYLKLLTEFFEKNPQRISEVTKPALSLDELKALHDHYCIEEATIITETKTDTVNPETMKNATESSSASVTEGEQTHTPGENNHKVTFDNPQEEERDPMNRANPKVRDYVLDDSKMTADGKQHEVGSTSSIGEPANFKDAFRMPDEHDPNAKVTGPGQSKGPSNSGGSPNPGPKSNPVNPAFEDMSNTKKNKQTKRSAKYLVEIVCMGIERGYVYWVTKDINQAKIAEYELKNTVELEAALSTPDGQLLQTVRQFFQQKCAEAELYAAVDPTDKEEWADALADVLMEKGIAPTPTQTLILVSLKVVGMKILTGLGQTMEINVVLQSAKDLKKNTRTADDLTEHIRQHPVQEERQETAEQHNDDNTDNGRGEGNTSLSVINN